MSFPLQPFFGFDKLHLHDFLQKKRSTCALFSPDHTYHLSMNALRLVIIGLLFFLISCDKLAKIDSTRTSDDPAMDTQEDPWIQLAYKQAPADNPLKGFVRWRGDSTEDAFQFPHSMEYANISLRKLMTGPNSFDWGPLEALLDEITARGHHALFRVVCDIPHVAGEESITRYLPDFIIHSSIRITPYDYKATTDSNKKGYSPDYDDPLMTTYLTRFIRALGQEYDGDPRIAFVLVGLLGHYGEWHTTGQNELMANAATQEFLLSTFDQVFDETKILMRTPEKGNAPAYDVGYHDDSFGYTTLTHQNTDLNMLDRLTMTGELFKWQTEPFGGETSPSIADKIFFSDPLMRGVAEDFIESVHQTHATWMLMSSLFDASVWPQGLPEDFRQSALTAAHLMGYEITVHSYQIIFSEGLLTLRVRLANLGVAPFYYKWPVQVALVDGGNSLVEQKTLPWDIRTLPARVNRKDPVTLVEFATDMPMHSRPSKSPNVLLSIPNPHSSNQFLRLANPSQDQDLPGWITLKE